MTPPRQEGDKLKIEYFYFYPFGNRSFTNEDELTGTVHHGEFYIFSEDGKGYEQFPCVRHENKPKSIFDGFCQSCDEAGDTRYKESKKHTGWYLAIGDGINVPLEMTSEELYEETGLEAHWEFNSTLP